MSTRVSERPLPRVRARTRRGHAGAIPTIKYVYWQEDDMWLGYLDEFPDYMTQGVTIEELQENLRDIYRDIAGGRIPGVRRAAQLRVS